MTEFIYYEDDPASDYAVEIGDHVEVDVDGLMAEGKVTQLHPKSHEVTVRYEDHHDSFRTSGNPRRRSVRSHVLAVNLIRRDG